MLCKTLSLNDASIKLDGDTGKFAGYASVFGGVDSYGDTILRGAYDSTLRGNGKPKMFFNHDSWSLPIGKWISAKEDDHGLLVEGELTLGNPQSDAVRAALKHGTVDGLSIGYYLKKGDFEETEDGGRIIKKVSKLVEVSIVTFPADEAARVDLASVKSMKDINEGMALLKKAIDLHAGHMDGSVPTSEASQQQMMDMMVEAYTMIAGEKPAVSMKAMEIETIRDFERFLRDAGGLSKGLAEALVSRAKIVFAQGEPGAGEVEAKAMDKLQAMLHRVQARIPQ